MGKVLMRPGGGSSDLDMVTTYSADVRKGKLYIDHEGDIQEGTLKDISTGTVVKTTIDGNKKSVNTFNDIKISADNTVAYLSPNLEECYIGPDTYIGVKSINLGDCESNYVLEGKTYSSYNGIKVAGTCPNNGDHKDIKSYDVESNNVNIRIPNGQYSNTASNKDPYITISKSKLAEIMVSYFGINVIENFKLAQLYSRKITVSWTLSRTKIWTPENKSTTRTELRKGLCTGVRVIFKKDGNPGNPVNLASGALYADIPMNSIMGTYTSNIIDPGTYSVGIFPYVTLPIDKTFNDSYSGENRIYSTGDISYKTITISDINGSFSLKEHKAGIFTVPAGVNYIGYVLVGDGGEAYEGQLTQHSGRNGRNYESTQGSGGGGGGYFKEGFLKVTPGQSIFYCLGNARYNDQYTSIEGAKLIVQSTGQEIFSPNGSKGWNQSLSDGGSGGSGGGTGSGGSSQPGQTSGNGGSNGSDGLPGTASAGSTPGTGQHATTYSKLTKTLYSGGGGGGAGSPGGGAGSFESSPGAGGAGGGGYGGAYRESGRGASPVNGLGGGSGGSSRGVWNPTRAGVYGGAIGCIYLAWGDSVMEAYGNEILKMENGG